MKSSTGLSFVIVAVIVSGCGMFNKAGELSMGSSEIGSGAAANTALTQQAVAILTTNCISCHGSSGQGGISNINDPAADVSAGLIVPGSPASSSIYTSISTGAMPIGMSMSSADIQTIQTWIQTGFQTQPGPSPSPGASPSPSPSPSPSSTGTATTVSYAASIQPVLTSKCVSCHGANGGNAPLNSYTNVLKTVKPDNPAASQLYTKIAPGGSMANHAPAGFATEVSNWITQGALNN